MNDDSDLDVDEEDECSVLFENISLDQKEKSSDNLEKYLEQARKSFMNLNKN